MLKIYKYLKAWDWVFVVLIVGITIAQVYFTMTVVDYVQYTIQAISNISNGLDGAGVGDIWYNGGMMVVYALCMGVCQVATCFIAARVASNLSATLRHNLFEKVNGYSTAEINKFSTASLITRTTNDVQQVQMANVMMLRMLITAPVTAIWAICKINASNAQLTWATVIAVVFLVVCIVGIMIAVMPKFSLMQKLTDKLNGVSRENLTGIRVVRAYNAQKFQEDKFEKANNDFTKLQLFANRVIGLMSPVMILVMNGVSLAIYIIGAYLMNAGEISYATVSSFMMLASQVIMSFLMLLMMFVMLPRAEICAKRINKVLDTPSTVLDPEEIYPDGDTFSPAADMTMANVTEDAENAENAEVAQEMGTVEFRNVSFKYPDSDTNVIEDISFKAEKGQTIAFIGSTGSGKSTLINLVPRFYDATKGEVLVDGKNVKEYKQHDLRDKIGYVPQKGVLFTGTIAENIGYGGVDDIERIQKAAQIAEADAFINEKGDGYDSFIAQGGKNVSGGQKQRLCIARAAVLEPEILIFDDSFSALDYKTDRKVRENLKDEMKDTTCLIVAQRIGTIMDADKIIVLDEGKAVGYGTHEELLKTCDVYKEIALSQLSEEELGLCQA